MRVHICTYDEDINYLHMPYGWLILGENFEIFVDF